MFIENVNKHLSTIQSVFAVPSTFGNAASRLGFFPILSLLREQTSEQKTRGCAKHAGYQQTNSRSPTVSRRTSMRVRVRMVHMVTARRLIVENATQEATYNVDHRKDRKDRCNDTKCDDVLIHNEGIPPLKSLFRGLRFAYRYF